MDTSHIGANVASCAGHTLEEAADKLEQLGFQTIGFLGYSGARHSIGELPGFWFNDLTTQEKDCLRSLAERFKYKSMHAPFQDAPLFTYSPRVKELAMDMVRESVDAIEFLGGSAVAVHFNRRSLFEPPEYWTEILDTFRELGDYASGKGVFIGIETGYPANLDLFVEMITKTNHPNVGVTLDVGHLVSSIPIEVRQSPGGSQAYNDTLSDLIYKLGPKIAHVHVHDVAKENWRDHRTPGTGLIDFSRLMADLRSVGYAGLMEMELEEPLKEKALVDGKRVLEQALWKADL